LNLENQFAEVIELINKTRYKALKSVNTKLIELHWQVGEYISKKLESAEWGMSVVDKLADYLQSSHLELKGFNRRGLYRMKQFYETYRENEKLSPLVRELSWTNNIIILSKIKSMEEKEFYLKLAIKENYSTRELGRQIDSSYYERYMLTDKIVSSLMTQIQFARHEQ